jgi:hypothetical protein
MQRRQFLQATTAAAGALVTVPVLSNAQDVKGDREYFELRSYTVKPGKVPLMDAYLDKSLIPALNRLGVKPVGVFYENTAIEKPVAYVLIRYKSLEEYATAAAGVSDDPQYQKAAADYLAAEATDPVYDRIESSLLRGIAGQPGLTAPALKSRLFNLRIYESHNEAAALKKIEMFNQAELAIFRRVGLTPVLFGEALIGSRLPNLTYLLVYDDDDARQAAWKKFGGDPEWQKLRAIPEYTDKRIVSKITNKLLTPTPYSQV